MTNQIKLNLLLERIKKIFFVTVLIKNFKIVFFKEIKLRASFYEAESSF